MWVTIQWIHILTNCFFFFFFQSFQHKNFWMARDAGSLNDGEVGYDNSSRIEPKRGHPCFTDTSGTESELFSSKKQAIEAIDNRPVSGTSHTNVFPWHNTSCFQSFSGQFTDRLFGSEAVRTVSMVDSSVPSVGGGNLNMGRKDFNDQYGGNTSMGLSMSHTVQDFSGCISFGGIRKVKVNQVRDSSLEISASMGHSCDTGDNNTTSTARTYEKSDGDTISLGPTCSDRDENDISIGPTFSKADGSFISMGHTFNKGNGNFMSMGHNYNKGNDNTSSMGQPFDKGDCNLTSMDPSYGKAGNVISMATSFDKGHETFISMGPAFDKASENFISMGPSYCKGDDGSISNCPTYDKVDANITSMGSVQDRGDSSILSMGHDYKVEGNTISFGGFDVEPEANPSGSLISGYNVLMSNQSLDQTSELQVQKDFSHSSANPIVNNAAKANLKTDTALKNKEAKASKKVPPNNFPSNVKSLLSTGMLDGVPVKYVSWSREKSLRGTIKGTGYLCGCMECNYSKALNAYEFERHANCKTKHPNNHIYFDNGKTIYSVVQELKNTSQVMLFDAIQNVTGSQINQKNFHIWKASYQAATRELQRIYGKDEIVMPSFD
uniref:Tify domain-containing protein n=1 Tax=Rhizophora mucronata TaxID=61149 RepID=A0A2P2KDE8_RHIMU